MKKIKSLLIALLCAVSMQNAAAQAYPFETKNDEHTIKLYTEPIYLGDSLLETKLEMLLVRNLYPIYIIALKKTEVADSNKSALFETMRRLAALIPERGANIPYNATITLANGNRMEAKAGLIATSGMQAINKSNPSMALIDFAVILGTKASQSSETPNDSAEKIQKTVAELCASDIVRFEIAGETFTFNDLRTADTLREMLKTLEQNREERNF